MDIEQVIGFVVNRCAFSLRQTFFEFMAANGHALTPEEGAILNHLWNQDRLTQSELLDVVYKGPSTLSRQIDALERKKLVVRAPCEEDKRKTRICLTEEGRKMEGEMISYAEQLIKRLRCGVDDDQIQQTIRTLNLLRQNAIEFSRELKKWTGN